MKELVKDAAIDLANLLTRFSFDLDGLKPEQLVGYWLSRYPTQWVQLALVEALYQGRYKARSIEQILALWRRRGHPLYHFNHEFERIVRGRFSRHLLMQPPTRIKQAPPAQPKAAVAPPLSQSSVAPFNSEPLTESELEPADTELQPEEEDNLQLEDELQSLPDQLQLLSSAESLAFLEQQPLENSAAPTAKELPIQAFKPVVVFQSETISKMKELALAANRSPVEQIDQFVPTAAPSDFYSKLRAVATQTAGDQ
ncbi:hypothetical protein IFO70_20890 [Phormidium tenue FACHB-886]|nr:hypothetical protein [Phormidium tenue FACHB-886]